MTNEYKKNVRANVSAKSASTARQKKYFAQKTINQIQFYDKKI